MIDLKYVMLPFGSRGVTGCKLQKKKKFYNCIVFIRKRNISGNITEEILILL